jgi:hypothetical protein
MFRDLIPHAEQVWAQLKPPEEAVRGDRVNHMWTVSMAAPELFEKGIG